MAIGQRNFVNPGAVLAALIDDNDIQFQVGQGEDIREFNDILIGRISDACRDDQISEEQEANSDIKV